MSKIENETLLVNFFTQPCFSVFRLLLMLPSFLVFWRHLVFDEHHCFYSEFSKEINPGDMRFYRPRKSKETELKDFTAHVTLEQKQKLLQPLTTLEKTKVHNLNSCRAYVLCSYLNPGGRTKPPSFLGEY